MPRRGNPPKRGGRNALQIVVWVVIALVVTSMVLSALPIAPQ
ncbi:MAG: hypothetical protein AB7P40_30835 [Chloroflexota bacterium]